MCACVFTGWGLVTFLVDGECKSVRFLLGNLSAVGLNRWARCLSPVLWGKHEVWRGMVENVVCPDICDVILGGAFCRRLLSEKEELMLLLFILI